MNEEQYPLPMEEWKQQEINAGNLDANTPE